MPVTYYQAATHPSLHSPPHWLLFPCTTLSRPLLTVFCLHRLVHGFSTFSRHGLTGVSGRCGTAGHRMVKHPDCPIVGGCSLHPELPWRHGRQPLLLSSSLDALLGCFQLGTITKKGCSKYPYLSLFVPLIGFSTDRLPFIIGLCLLVQETATLGARSGVTGCHSNFSRARSRRITGSRPV